MLGVSKICAQAMSHNTTDTGAACLCDGFSEYLLYADFGFRTTLDEKRSVLPCERMTLCLCHFTLFL